MTEEQLKTFRAECRALAAEYVAAWLYRAVVQARPDALPLLRQSANEALREYQKIVLSGQPAEYSDLASAEFREQFELVLEKIFAAHS